MDECLITPKLLQVTLYSLNKTLKVAKFGIWCYKECHLE